MSHGHPRHGRGAGPARRAGGARRLSPATAGRGAGRLRHAVLLGPDGPGFWRIFRASPEFGDGGADPLDRWSERVIGGLAAEFRGQALFPFGGPPWHRSPPGRGGAARPGSRRWVCWCMRGSGSWSPIAERSRSPNGWTLPDAADAALRRPAQSPASTPARSAALTGGRLRSRRLPRLARYRGGRRLLGARLRGAARLPGRRSDSAGGAIGLSHDGLSWQASACAG